MVNGTKRKTNTFIKAFAAILALCILFSGCVGNRDVAETSAIPTGSFTEDENQTDAGSKEPEQTNPSTPAPQPSGPINYLTGLPAQDGEENKMRSYAFVINNIDVAAKYQAGLSDADVIFEYEVEARITRLLALYHNPRNTPKIGSVRSARPVSLNIAMGFDAIYVHAGASPRANSDLKKYSYTHIDGGRSAFRDKTVAANAGLEHSLFYSGEKTVKQVDSMSKIGTRTKLKEGYDTPFSFYENDTQISGNSAAKLKIKYRTYQPYYTYDSGTKLYKRDGYKFAGAKTDTLTFKNIIVLYVPNKDSGDHDGHRNFEDIGSGGGIYAANGEYIPIKWSKESANTPLRLLTMQGEPLKINRGKTFISYVNGADDCQVSGS